MYYIEFLYRICNVHADAASRDKTTEKSSNHSSYHHFRWWFVVVVLFLRFFHLFHHRNRCLLNEKPVRIRRRRISQGCFMCIIIREYIHEYRMLCVYDMCVYILYIIIIFLNPQVPGFHVCSRDFLCCFCAPFAFCWFAPIYTWTPHVLRSFVSSRASIVLGNGNVHATCTPDIAYSFPILRRHCDQTMLDFSSLFFCKIKNTKKKWKER